MLSLNVNIDRVGGTFDIAFDGEKKLVNDAMSVVKKALWMPVKYNHGEQVICLETLVESACSDIPLFEGRLERILGILEVDNMPEKNKSEQLKVAKDLDKKVKYLKSRKEAMEERLQDLKSKDESLYDVKSCNNYISVILNKKEKSDLENAERLEKIENLLTDELIKIGFVNQKIEGKKENNYTINNYVQEDELKNILQQRDFELSKQYEEVMNNFAEKWAVKNINNVQSLEIQR